MTLVLDIFVLLSLFELVLVSKLLWPIRRPLAAGTAIGMALVTGLLVGTSYSWAMVVFGLISIYRVINLLRIVQDRNDEHHLRAAVRRTTLTLFVTQILILTVIALADRYHMVSDSWWVLLSAMQLGVAGILYASTRRSIRKTVPYAVSEHYSDSQLPALTVCIPARNETTALEECLRSLVASTYPKLEIIVLDDCSQGGHTSDIIRGFAHDGVRFIKGTVPTNDWLAKNWAYQQLFEAASGQLVLFCGVDVRFEPAALRSLITTQLAKQKRMVSVIPRNMLPRRRDLAALLIQPARYAWELALPRRHFNKPPVLSSCWVAEHSLFDRNGAFAAVKKSISPEAYFARQAIIRDGYSFVQATDELAITSFKTRAQQWDTAVRTRYPLAHRRPETTLLVALIESLLLAAAPVVALIGALQGLWLQAALATLSSILLGATYGAITGLTYRRVIWFSYLLAPFAALVDVYIRHESLWRYEFGEIVWKGRNVCMPIIRVIPRFPTMIEGLEGYQNYHQQAHYERRQGHHPHRRHHRRNHHN